MKDYVSLDLETTGFSPETCDILEVGAWKIKDGVVVDKFCTLVRPVMYIPRTIQSITGITEEMVADCDTIEPVLFEFFDFCEDLPFLGHNLAFDFKFLQYKGKFIGLDFSLGGTRQGIDTLSISKQYVNTPSHKLEDLAEYFNIDTGKRKDFHRAEYDSYITKLLYDRLLFANTNVLGVVNPVLLNTDSKKYGKAVNNDTLSFV